MKKENVKKATPRKKREVSSVKRIHSCQHKCKEVVMKPISRWAKFKRFMSKFNVLSLILEARMDNQMKSGVIVAGFVTVAFMVALGLLFLNSCTYTFQNTIATGSSDVVDSQPQTDADISPEVTVPFSP